MAVKAKQAPVALVTGGGTGVGSATAQCLAARGYRVAVNYRKSGEEAKATADACRSAGGEAVALQGDVADDGDCRRLINSVSKEWGRLDVLVSSAGTTQFTRLQDLEAQNAEDFQRVYATNVVGAYQIARAASPMLKESGNGAVVMVSSIAGMNGNGSSLAYVASKGALNSLTLSLARVLAPAVRVNAVLPGLIDSGWFLNGMDEESYHAIRDGFAAASALDTICSPQDIADAVVFLAADAKKMTGQLMVVDSGFMLGRAVKVSRDR
jgi:3-oxoacyl-[acyl-carrier protein] reductase